MAETHYMIDIETLGTRPNSYILSIGVLKFNPMGNPEAKVGDNDSIPIVWEMWDIIPKSCQDIGLEMDADTVLWWFQQSEEARMDVVQGLYKEKVEIRTALVDMCSFMKNHCDGEEVYIWAKSPQFDIIILENAFRKSKISTPWKFQNIFDVRTVYKMWGNRDRPDYSNVVKDRLTHNDRTMSKHNPIFDCYLQAYILSHIWKKLRLENEE